MNFIGKKCLVCGKNSGIYVGEVAEHDGNSKMLLKNVRRIRYWVGAATVLQIAAEGIKNHESSQITMPIDEIGLFDVIFVIPMTDIAIKDFEEIPEWKIK